MAEKMSIAPVEALDFRLAVQYIERIADLAADVAAATGEPLESRFVARIEAIARRAAEMLSKSVANLFRFDSDKVGWVMSAERELIEDVGRLRTDLILSPKEASQACLQVIEALLRIGEAAKDIVDLALPKG
jgi:phosphate uptake regulator